MRPVTAIFCASMAVLAALAAPPAAQAQAARVGARRPTPMAHLDEYPLFSDRTLDYADLESALARGLKPDEVAAAANIAQKAGVPLRDVVDAVLRGETFPKLADRYDLNLRDVLDVLDERNRIAGYMLTYETTGAKTRGRYFFPFVPLPLMVEP